MDQVRQRASRGRFALAMILPALFAASPAAAEISVSQLIVEFKAGGPRTSDIEIANSGDEPSYVVVEPREILHAGMANEEPATTPDPAKLGLLTSPARLILQPGQRRTIRIAAIGNPAMSERVYRVTVKPVSGDVVGDATGLKLLVGYDLLILVRPAAVRNDVRSDRKGDTLTLTNAGNASVELAEGKQCEPSGDTCAALPARRLYAGASWSQKLPLAANGEYRVRSAEGWSTLKF